jgi:hypothetical protein
MTTPPPPLPPTGFTVTDAAPPGYLGAALMGRQLLHCQWWLGPGPDDGWQRGTVARHGLCPRGAFSGLHVVAYTRQTSALRGTADSLLDSASYGSRSETVGAALASLSALSSYCSRPAAGVVAGSGARRTRP